jgi:hypothetical protein
MISSRKLTARVSARHAVVPAGYMYVTFRIIFGEVWRVARLTILGGWPNLLHGIPIWGCPTLPAFFAGGWGLCADYNLREMHVKPVRY